MVTPAGPVCPSLWQNLCIGLRFPQSCSYSSIRLYNWHYNQCIVVVEIDWLPQASKQTSINYGLQSVQNAAARLVTGTRRSVSYTGYQCASASTSRWPRSSTRRLASYLADDCRLVADARERRLRSTVSRTCVVTRTFSTFGDRAFSAAGPGLWNSLPSHLKDADLSNNEFRRSLKTFLFGQWGHGAVWTLLIAPTRNIRTYFTYLLTAASLFLGKLRDACGSIARVYQR